VFKKLIVVFSILLPTSTYSGGSVNYEYIELLMKHIELSTGMSAPRKGEIHYPRVIFTDDVTVHQLVCKRKKSCSAWAATKSNMVFLTSKVKLDEPEGDSILYHELVHVMQNAMYGPATSCDEWAHREVQAYQLQHRYATAKGHDMDWIIEWIQTIRNRCKY